MEELQYCYYHSSRHSRSDGPVWPVFAIIGAVIIIQIIINIYNKHRRNKIREYCFRNGLDFCDDPLTPGAISAVSSFKEQCYDIMKKGDSCGVRAMMHGMMGEMEFRSADYYYEVVTHTSKGRRTTTYTFTLTEFYKENSNLGYFYARDEGLLDGIGVAFGNQDIDFSSDKRFSDKFILQGCEADVRKLFNQRVRNAFVTNHVNGYQYEGSNDCLLVYCSGYKTIEGRLQMLQKGYNVMRALAPDNPDAQFMPEMPPLEDNPYRQQQNAAKGKMSWKDACDPFNDFK